MDRESMIQFILRYSEDITLTEKVLRILTTEELKEEYYWLAFFK